MIGPQLQIIHPPRDKVREEVWLRAWNSVAQGGTINPTPYADGCLADFDERFPDPAKTWRERDAAQDSQVT